MAAPVTHFEINARDGKRAQDFYSALFGWKINADNEMRYGLVDTGVKMGINGGIGQADQNSNPSVTFYVQVEDIQKHLDNAVALGARIIVPLTDVPGMVTFAQFADPEGNVVGLLKGPQSPPKAAKPKKKAAPRKKKKVVRAKPKKRKRGRR
jgi:predicted enzyme related to lactoylglutathione lyase